MDAGDKETLNLKLDEDVVHKTTSISGVGISTQYSMSMAVLEWDSEGEIVTVKRYQASDHKTAIPSLSRYQTSDHKTAIPSLSLYQTSDHKTAIPSLSLYQTCDHKTAIPSLSLYQTSDHKTAIPSLSQYQICEEHRSHSLINSAKAELEYCLPLDLVGSKAKYVHGPIEENKSNRSFSPVNNATPADMLKAQSRKLLFPIIPISSNRSPSCSPAQSSRPESISIQGMDDLDDSLSSVIMADEIVERHGSAESIFQQLSFSSVEWTNNRKTCTKNDTKQQQTVEDSNQSKIIHEKELPDVKDCTERSEVDMELIKWKCPTPSHDCLCISSSDTDSAKRRLKANSKKEMAVSVDQTKILLGNDLHRTFDLSKNHVKILIDKEDSNGENMIAFKGHAENAEIHSNRKLSVETPTAEEEIEMHNKPTETDEPIMIEVLETEKTVVGENKGNINNFGRLILETEKNDKNKELTKDIKKKPKELNEEVGVGSSQKRVESAEDKEKLDIDTADEVSDIETDLEHEITVAFYSKEEEEQLMEDLENEIKGKHFESVQGVQLRRKGRKPKKQSHVSNGNDVSDHQEQQRLKYNEEPQNLMLQEDMMVKSIRGADTMLLQRKKSEREMKNTKEQRIQTEIKEQCEKVEMRLTKEEKERQYTAQLEQLRHECLKAEELVTDRLEQERHCMEQDHTRECET